MDAIAFGRYRLLELVGAGGMGQVYKAYDTSFDRTVALKLLPAHLAADPAFRERFRREAHSAGNLNEPHIVTVLEFGEHDGHLFLTMPLIEGTDVGSLLARDGPMAPEWAVSIIEQAAAALDAAHAAGVVHRDVKPANMLVTAKSFVYLIDFGIARTVTDPGLTGTGATIGTIAYMAPERLGSGRTDARTDVYALACVLYECLTGARPFPGESLEQVITAHLSTPPPRPSQARPDVPVALDDVIARGMAKDPDHRYASAGALAAAARDALPTPKPPPPLPIPLAAAAAAPAERAATTTVATARPPRPPGRNPARHPELSPAPTPSVSRPGGGQRVRFLVIGVILTLILATVAGVWYLNRDIPLTVTATIDVGKNPSGVAVDTGTHTAYVTNHDDGTVSVIDTTGRTVTATIPVGRSPHGVAVDAGTHTAYVTNYYDGTVSVIDTTGRTVTATIPVGRSPHGVAVDAGTHTAYVTNTADGTVSVIDTTGRTVTATIPVGRSPHGVAVDAGTHTAYVTNYYDGTVSVIDTTTRTVTATIPVGAYPDGVAVDTGTHTAYVTNTADGTVSVIDTTTRAVTATIPVGQGPEGVAVDTGTHTAYVTNYYDRTVSVIESSH